MVSHIVLRTLAKNIYFSIFKKYFSYPV